MNKVYLVWENEEGCDDCSCSYPRSLVGVFVDKDLADAEAKRRWGGEVQEQKIRVALDRW